MKRTVLFLLFALLWAPAVLLAGGSSEVEAPTVSVDSWPSYIAPGGRDDQNTSLTLNSLSMEAPSGAAIRRWTLNVYDNRGSLVYSQNQQETSGRGFFGDLFNGEWPSVEIPSTIQWDGTNSAGERAPDGEYFFQVTIRDSNGTEAYTPPYRVVVDSTPPLLNGFEPEFSSFSPNEDGLRDQVSFAIEGGSASSWLFEVQSESGDIVYSEENSDEAEMFAVSSFSWDGLNTGGEISEDGSYVVRVRARDLAGNESSLEQSIRLSTSVGTVVLDVLGAAHVSPVLNEPLEIGITSTVEETITDWVLRIESQEGLLVRRYGGSGALPTSLSFDGRGNAASPDGNYRILDDGTYRARLEVTQANGALVQSDQLPIVVDSKAPRGELFLSTAPTETAGGNVVTFGGSQRHSLLVSGSLSADEGESWIASLSHEDGLSTSLDLSGQSVFELRWDGRWPLDADDSESMAPDGVYQLRLQGYDLAGNQSTALVRSFIKDSSAKPTPQLTIPSPLLGPGGDLGLETAEVQIDLDSAGVEKQTLRFIAEDRRTYYSLERNEAFESFAWDGNRAQNIAAPDSSYRVQLELWYRNGEYFQVESDQQIILSRARPWAALNSEELYLSPDGDGSKDQLLVVQNSSSETLWTGTFYDENDQVVRRFEWEGTAEDFTWDGTTDDGQLADDGLYRYVLSTTNEVGNRSESELQNIKLDTLSSSIDVEINELVISPNGDGFKDEALLNPVVGDREGIRAWDLIIENISNGARAILQGGRVLPEELRWDGSLTTGQIIDGEYSITFGVEYEGGASTQREIGATIIVVQTPPLGRVTVNPELFSPDGDGLNDTLSIELDARAADRPIDTWELNIFDPQGGLFISWNGAGNPPETIEWDGTNGKGELVQSALDYGIQFVLRDELLNTHKSSTIASVDILVIREGDRIRIKLPSIQFAPFTSDLFAVEGQVLTVNLETLRKLANILNRYQNYSIRIEGHAAHLLSGSAREREQQETLIPLSGERAREVRKALTILGVDWNRMETAALGGSQPVVPHDDDQNRWKNRRVEFILEPEAQ